MRKVIDGYGMISCHNNVQTLYIYIRQNLVWKDTLLIPVISGVIKMVLVGGITFSFESLNCFWLL